MAKTIEQIKQICIDNDVIYISDFIRTDQPFSHTCPVCGEPKMGTIQSITRHCKCKKCAGTQKYTETQIRNACLEYGVTYVSGYKNADTKFKFICSCGNESESILGSLKRGHKCKACFMYTEDEIVKELALYGLGLINYVNADSPISYICSCGCIGKSTLASIRKGFKCGNCVQQAYYNLFIEYDCQIIEYNSAYNITYLCHCGSQHKTTGQHFREGEKNCPNCRVPWNYNPDRLTRPSLYFWKKELLYRDSFECRNCGESEQLNAHHIIAWSTRPDLESDITNGIILCWDCHIGLHSKYGINVGKENLEREFGIIL